MIAFGQALESEGVAPWLAEEQGIQVHYDYCFISVRSVERRSMQVRRLLRRPDDSKSTAFVQNGLEAGPGVIRVVFPSILLGINRRFGHNLEH